MTLSVPEVAERLGISKGKAYELVYTKQIPSIRFGRRWLIPRIRFEAMLGGETSFLNKSATP
nr:MULTISPECIES: helix-turn-helix domain-containing protein [Dehalogenimonas]